MEYMDIIPRVPKKKKQRAIELLQIIQLDCVTDDDIKEQEKAQKELEDMIKNQ